MNSRTDKEVNAKRPSVLQGTFRWVRWLTQLLQPCTARHTRCSINLHFQKEICIPADGKKSVNNPKVILEKMVVYFSPSTTHESTDFLSAPAMLLSGSQSCGSTLASAQQIRCSIGHTERTAHYHNIRMQEQTLLTWTTQMKSAGKWSRFPAWRKWMPHLETTATRTLLFAVFFTWIQKSKYHVFGYFSFFSPLVLESNSAYAPTQRCHWLWGTWSH